MSRACGDADASFRRAIDIAWRQQTKSLELRAATSLSHVLQHRGEHEEGRSLLTEVYAWFTEGFDPPDLQDAQALLDALENVCDGSWATRRRLSSCAVVQTAGLHSLAAAHHGVGRIHMSHRPSAATLALLSALLFGCGDRIDAFSPASADRAVTGSSRFPVAVDPTRVGKYPGLAKSGSGYFYDDVLEYRVWLHPERGASPRAGDGDYFAAFAEYERAATFSRSAAGAEEPLVLVRQLEWINEPTPGQYVVEKGERITEWRVEWLNGSKRDTNSIREFLANPRPPREETSLTTDLDSSVKGDSWSSSSPSRRRS